MTPVPGDEPRSAAGAGVLVAAALLLFLSAWTLPVNGQPVERATEQSIKAAYLYKFAAYVEWPANVFTADSASLTIGVFAADSLAEELRQMTAGRTVDGREIAVRRVASPDELRGVQILFIGGTAVGDVAPLVDAASAHSVLVVTESGDALQNGSVINFLPVDKKIRFDVSLESADRSRLKLSSRLLAVANYVEPRQR